MEEKESTEQSITVFRKELREEVAKEFHQLSKYGISNIEFNVLSNGSIAVKTQQLTKDFWKLYADIAMLEEELVMKAIKDLEEFTEWGQKTLDVEFEFSLFLLESGQISFYVSNTEELAAVPRVSRLITKIKNSTANPYIKEEVEKVEMEMLFNPENVVESIKKLIEMEIDEHQHLLESFREIYVQQMKNAFYRVGQKRNQIKRQYGIY